MEFSAFIHRRDLRREDNAALQLLRRAHPGPPVVHVFVLDPRQANPRLNPYFSRPAFTFMMECVKDLGLHVVRAPDTETALKRLAKAKKGRLVAAAWNKDYTPFARQRDERLTAWCADQGVQVITAEDYTLFPEGQLAPAGKTHYEVFTPFYNKASPLLSDLVGEALTEEADGPRHRAAALRILDQIRAGAFDKYKQDREFPALDKTTHLSVYMKFGCVSVREVMRAAMEAKNDALVRELLWREFCAQLVAGAPRMLQGQLQLPGAANLSLRADRPWRPLDEAWFKRWKEGTTGFPLVDASMRCLGATGFLHNRCRMIVASFLCKDMLVDWREGERYFASQLLDYDPASNSFGWQWSAGVGADAPPFSRVFNPWLQGAKFDRGAGFIKQWVPQLRRVAPADVHDPKAVERRCAHGYPAPMLDHAAAARAARGEKR